MAGLTDDVAILSYLPILVSGKGAPEGTRVFPAAERLSQRSDRKRRAEATTAGTGGVGAG